MARSIVAALGPNNVQHVECIHTFNRELVHLANAPDAGVYMPG